MKFSVVVPVYKVEEYINECVDSILNQSFDDFEVILVDDGSPDNCGKICDEYAKKDERVRVIHKENGGLVSARQAGIKIARGEYIVNIDSDDYIDKDMLKNSDEIINSYSPDAIYFSMMNFKGQKRWTFDECIKEGFYDEKDIKDRNDDLIRAEKLLMEDMPVIPIIFNKTATLKNEQLNLKNKTLWWTKNSNYYTDTNFRKMVVKDYDEYLVLCADFITEHFEEYKANYFSYFYTFKEFEVEEFKKEGSNYSYLFPEEEEE